ncbi:hypothetical protein KIMH_09820 [Bombiscardovia apis]|uniref:Uncharacterized protein n=1 Tax=Bombiscardovia apis TaxID=2932182 RepID=A0ABM8BD96_9BIFI|nr:hypothetical protein [Bombiscardovia apis]BDR54871.1 hypothetical protein KIMH_09820 [Bombiscardovia apis]
MAEQNHLPEGGPATGAPTGSEELLKERFPQLAHISQQALVQQVSLYREVLAQLQEQLHAAE